MRLNTENICRDTEKDIVCLTMCKSSLLGKQDLRRLLMASKSAEELTAAFSDPQTSFLLHFLSIMLTEPVLYSSFSVSEELNVGFHWDFWPTSLITFKK